MCLARIELAVEVVDPGVVGALEADRLAAGLFDDRGAPVLADVVEGAQDTIPGAHDHERLAELLRQEVRPGFGGILIPPDTHPVAQEPGVALVGPHGLVVIGPRRQERGAPERTANLLDLCPAERGAGGHRRTNLRAESSALDRA